MITDCSALEGKDLLCSSSITFLGEGQLPSPVVHSAVQSLAQQKYRPLWHFKHIGHFPINDLLGFLFQLHFSKCHLYVWVEIPLAGCSWSTHSVCPLKEPCHWKNMNRNVPRAAFSWASLTPGGLLSSCGGMEIMSYWDKVELIFCFRFVKPNPINKGHYSLTLSCQSLKQT